MNQDLAAEISKSLLSCSGKLDKSIILIKGLVDDDTFRRYCRKVGDTMALFYLDFLRGIYTQYPELEPESIRSGAQVPKSEPLVESTAVEVSFQPALATLQEAQEILDGVKSRLCAQLEESAEAHIESLESASELIAHLRNLLVPQA